MIRWVFLILAAVVISITTPHDTHTQTIQSDTVGGWYVKSAEGISELSFGWGNVVYEGKSSFKIRYTVSEVGGKVVFEKLFSNLGYKFPQGLLFQGRVRSFPPWTYGHFVGPLFGFALSYRDTTEVFWDVMIWGLEDFWSEIQTSPQNRTPSLQYFDRIEFTLALTDEYGSYTTEEVGTVEVVIDELTILHERNNSYTPTIIDRFERTDGKLSIGVFKCNFRTYEFGDVPIGQSESAELYVSNIGGGNLAIQSITASVPFLTVTPAQIGLAPQTSTLFIVTYTPVRNMPPAPWFIFFDHNGESEQDTVFITGDTPTGIEDISENLPQEYVLMQNFPNPFNPETTISFSMPKPSHVRLSIYNLLGQEIAIVVNEPLGAGRHEGIWNAKGFPSGVYLYRITAGSFSSVKKMLVIK